MRKGYIRHDLGANDLGNSLFGISKDAHGLQDEELNSIKSLLKDSIKKQLKSAEFIKHLEDEINVTINSQSDSEIDEAVNRHEIIVAFIKFAWPDQEILYAIAQVKNIPLYLWTLGSDRELLPQNQSIILSGNTPNLRIDLLLLDDHIEKLEFVGFDSEFPNEEEVVYPAQPSTCQLIKNATLELLPFLLINGIDTGETILTDLFASHLTQEAFAATAYTNNIQQLLTAWCSIYSAVLPISGAYIAKKDFSKAKASLIAAHISALPFSSSSTIVLFFIKPILLSMGQNPSITENTNNFFSVSKWGIPLSIFSETEQLYFIASNNQYKAVVIRLATSGFALLMGYGLTFGAMGLPNLGIVGLGLTFLIRDASRSLIYLISKFFPNFRNIPINRKKVFDQIKNIYCVGSPIMVESLGKLGIGFGALIIMGLVGIDSLVAYQAVNQYSAYPQILVAAIASCCTKIVSHAFGAGNFASMALYVRNYHIFTSGFVALAVLPPLIYPSIFARLYINPQTQPEAMRHANILFRINAATLIADANEKITTNALQGIQDTKIPSIMRIFSFAFGMLLLSYIFSRQAGLDIEGFLSARTIGILLSFSLQGYRWMKIKDQPNLAASSCNILSCQRSGRLLDSPDSSDDEDSTLLTNSSSVSTATLN